MQQVTTLVLYYTAKNRITFNTGCIKYDSIFSCDKLDKNKGGG